MAVLHDVVFDSHHPASLARFWAAVLDGYDMAPYDHAELERLRSLGIEDVDDDPTVLVESPGQHPRFWFQKVPEAKTVKNRVHLDLRADDSAAELARLQELGAVLDDVQPNDHVFVLKDPQGNEFCVLR